MSESTDAREMIRHTLATLAYRGGKPLRDAPPSFAQFRSGPASKTPVEILAHIGDLMDWALSIAQGTQTWHDAQPLPHRARKEAEQRLGEVPKAHVSGESRAE